MDGAGGGDFAERDDVPDVLGEDVGSDEIDHARLVALALGGFDEAFIAGVAGALIRRGLDLDAEHASAVFDDEVIGQAVAIRLADAQPVFGGAGEEMNLGPLAPEFGVTGNVLHVIRAFDAKEEGPPAKESLLKSYTFSIARREG